VSVVLEVPLPGSQYFILNTITASYSRALAWNTSQCALNVPYCSLSRARARTRALCVSVWIVCRAHPPLVWPLDACRLASPCRRPPLGTKKPTWYRRMSGRQYHNMWGNHLFREVYAFGICMIFGTACPIESKYSGLNEEATSAAPDSDAAPTTKPESCGR
jgi:hypothetical protein